jgi:hypothetical protein
MSTRISSKLNAKKNANTIKATPSNTKSTNKRTSRNAVVDNTGIDAFDTPPNNKRIKQQQSTDTTKPHIQQLKQHTSSLIRRDLVVPSSWSHLDDNEVILRRFDMDMTYGTWCIVYHMIVAVAYWPCLHDTYSCTSFDTDT